MRRVEHFATKAAAWARIHARIHEYNHHRRHSPCQMMPRSLRAAVGGRGSGL